MRILLTRAILLPQLSDLLRNSPISCSIFLYLVTSFLRVAVSFLCGLQEKGNEIVIDCDWHSNETVTLRKHVTENKNMRNQWSNFLGNLRVVAIKLLELTQFASPMFSYRVEVRYHVHICKLTASAQYSSRKVYV